MNLTGSHVASVNPNISRSQETCAAPLGLPIAARYQPPSRLLFVAHIGPTLRPPVPTFAARSMARLAFVGEAEGPGLIAQEIVRRGFHRQVTAVAGSCGHGPTMVDGPHKGKDILR